MLWGGVGGLGWISFREFPHEGGGCKLLNSLHQTPPTPPLRFETVSI